MKLSLRGLAPTLYGVLLMLPATAVAEVKLSEPAPMNAGSNGDRCGEAVLNAPRTRLAPGDTAAIAWQGPAAATYEVAVSAGGRRFNTVARGIRAQAGDTSGKFRVSYTVPDRPCEDCVMRVAQLDADGDIAAVGCGLIAIGEGNGNGGAGDAGPRTDAGRDRDASGGGGRNDASVGDASASADASVTAPDAGITAVDAGSSGGAVDAGRMRSGDDDDDDRPRTDAGSRGDLGQQQSAEDDPSSRRSNNTRTAGSEGGCRCVAAGACVGDGLRGLSFLAMVAAVTVLRLRNRRC